MTFDIFSLSLGSRRLSAIERCSYIVMPVERSWAAIDWFNVSCFVNDLLFPFHGILKDR